MLNYPSFFNAQVGGYEIEQSLRFDPADDTTLTVHTGWTSERSWTWSCWIKTSPQSAHEQDIWLSRGTNCGLFISTTGELGSVWNDVNLGSGVYLRDPSAWYHIVVKAEDYSSASPGYSDIYIYVNNQLVQTRAAQTRGFFTFSTQTAYIGRYGNQTPAAGEFAGYMAEVHMTDGTAYDPTDFGEYDNNGVWRPIEVTGLNYGSNGFYHTFDPTATNGIGHDHSGNGNNSTPYGFTTSGTGTDVMSDTPTNNFATFNPLQITYQGSPTYSEGNLYFDLNDGGTTISTIGVNSGKWYCELRTEGTMSHRPLLGLNYTNPTSQGGAGNAVWPGQDIAYAYNGNKWVNYSSSSYGSSWSNGDIIGIALDLDSATQTVTFYRNGTSQGAINLPASGKTWHVSVGSYGADGDNLAFTANFGQRDFEYTQPSGYNSWCTANLPAPDIADGSKYFNTVLWTGTSAENSISTVGFQPGFTWIKGRDNNTNFVLVDAVRGATKVLESDSDAAEYTDAQSVKSFDTNGFTLGTSNDVNNSAANDNQYVAWNWKAGGSSSSNTAGSITSTVSANPSTGFSIVTYTGNGTSGATVGHGLGVKPSLLIVRRRPTTSNWTVYHSSVGATGRLILDLNYATQSSAGWWNNTEPTSTVFSIGNDGGTNSTTNNTYVAYCFAEVEGYSKAGSYTGNGSNDGPFVYCGFRPAFVIYKRTDSAGSWHIYDSARATYNPAEGIFSAEDPGQETFNVSLAFDILSNGFKLRGFNTGSINASGSTNVFMAFAENPFGGSGVSPATAR